MATALRVKDGAPESAENGRQSNLIAGRQDVVPGMALTYGQSITDGCIDWNTTVSSLNVLADAVAARRELKPQQVRERSA